MNLNNGALAWLLLLAASAPLAADSGNQILLRTLDPADGTAAVVRAGPHGEVFVVTTLPNSKGTRIIKFDQTGGRKASIDVQNLSAPSAAVDQQGNVIVAGPSYSWTSLIIKIDAHLQVLFTKSVPAKIYAIALGPSDAIYATGETNSAAFPVTPGAYRTQPPLAPTGEDQSRSLAFVLALSSGGDRVLYGTYFGGERISCNFGSGCIGYAAVNKGAAISVDAAGSVVIGGFTTATDLPTTPGALQSSCDCGYVSRFYAWGSGFVARFQPEATQQLQWSTYITGTSHVVSAFLEPPVSVGINTVLIDAAGAVYVAGFGPPKMPTTADSPQPTFDPPQTEVAGFVLKLNSTGTGVLWGTYFGDAGGVVRGLAVDPQGRIILSGRKSATSLDVQYVARVSTDGRTVIEYLEGPVGVSLDTTPAGTYVASGANMLWFETQGPGPSLFRIIGMNTIDATSLTAYTVISLFGRDIGPPAPLIGEIQSGSLTTALGGYKVLINGTPCPLLYADSKQINVVTPSNLSGSNAHLEIVTPTGLVDGPNMALTAPQPIIFTDTLNRAVALNQDGTLNSTSNRAKASSVMTIFVTGRGAPYSGNGRIIPFGERTDTISKVWMGDNRSFEVVYAGSAPGAVAGVLQIEFRVPGDVLYAQTLKFDLEIDDVRTSATVEVTP